MIVSQESDVRPSTQETQTPYSDWQFWLSTLLGTRVTVVWTDNRALMLSIKGSKPAGYFVRLHRMFLQAPAAVWRALASYMRSADPVARQTIRTFVQHHRHLIRHGPQWQQPSHTLQPHGRYFNLEAIYHALNHTYFANRIQARITWSRRPPQRPRHSMRFGSYHAADRLIRIHPLLDQAFVPHYVIENVIFHEMLHQLIPRRRVNGRWCVHPPEFRQHERQFPYYQQAEQWQRQQLSHLLRG
jgi:SprT-like family